MGDLIKMSGYRCRKGKNNSNYRHGMSRTRQYGIWLAMKKRCDYKNDISFHNYGGRGITYEKKWSAFVGFWEDMISGYQDNLTLDRIDNNENYCKENCRWVSYEVQSRNSRHNRKITINGVTKILTDWCRKFNIHVDTFYFRVNEKGMSEQEALTTKLNIKKSLAGKGIGYYEDNDL